tara:strand:- start:111 stop:296 length:186 start_codon:yes stop_codon:yes gene_type:complete
MRTAIYPGTFDPITYGHIDVIKKSLKIVDRIVVAITDTSSKNYFFQQKRDCQLLKNHFLKI